MHAVSSFVLAVACMAAGLALAALGAGLVLDDVIDALRQGTRNANAVAEETLSLVKKAMRQDYFGRKVELQGREAGR